MTNALEKAGFKVALLDVDLTGPNITDILCKKNLDVEDDMFIPSQDHGINYVSLGQIASEGDPVLWRNHDIEEAAEQLLSRTNWGDIEFLVVDFPPGTGTEAQTLMPMMDFVVVVTVPSVLSESNVRRIIEMMRETNTPILGLIKNMTKFICPDCGSEHKIFPEDHDFDDLKIPLLAAIPLNPKVAKTKVINEFPLEPILDAMKHPVILKMKDKSMKRLLIEMLFRREK